ncbi:hypothetical protein MiSe_35480 [Microseira wollei NIES-4236]|uniref:Uncharacterized protein n=1 Tax=Microseira wollei NIES-4236 TaxID=2530354 RepID=A0AAV3XEB5_9CYAN|nr:hypothetical protein MiSe_35480 [Microseira wollei NIES-4236]
MIFGHYASATVYATVEGAECALESRFLKETGILLLRIPVSLRNRDSADHS